MLKARLRYTIEISESDAKAIMAHIGRNGIPAHMGGIGGGLSPLMFCKYFLPGIIEGWVRQRLSDATVKGRVALEAQRLIASGEIEVGGPSHD